MALGKAQRFPPSELLQARFTLVALQVHMISDGVKSAKQTGEVRILYRMRRYRLIVFSKFSKRIGLTFLSWRPVQHSWTQL